MAVPIYLEVRNLHWRIGKKSVLKDISFGIKKGEYFSIIGPNGSGKTTLLKCLNRIYRIWAGEIFIRSIPLKNYNQRGLARLVGYVPQVTTSGYPFSVYEFVMMGRYPYLSPFLPPSSQDHKAVGKALEITETEGFQSRNISTLSGGERQKVFIAAALAQGAEIMLLDEPTTFLDPKHQDDIHKVLQSINRETGTTIISVTHDLNSILPSSDRVLALKGGETFFLGGPEELLETGILDRLFERPFVTLTHPGTGKPVVL